jgi:RHS repeat-associated protein
MAESSESTMQPGYSYDAVCYKFTGKERDAESGLDMFEARYYGSSLGRFMTPDWSAMATPVPYAKLENPQSLNLYAYMMNNPLGGADADGHCGPDYCMSGLIIDAYMYLVTHPMIGVVLSHPVAAYQIGQATPGHHVTNISTDATRIGAGLGLNENAAHEGSQVNAMRHTVWQATIASKFGDNTAIAVGDAHETNQSADLSIRTFSGKGALEAADQTTDLLNNQIGRSIGDASPGASMLDLAGKALDYYHSNGLYMASTAADGTVTVSQTKLSDSQYAAAKQRLKRVVEEETAGHSANARGAQPNPRGARLWRRA